MERKLWPELYRRIQNLATTVQQKYVHHQPHVILAVYFWAVLHERPLAWACREENWLGEAERPRRLPAASTLSRRLQRVGLGVVLQVLAKSLSSPTPPARVTAVDGKPLPVGSHSKDPDARRGGVGGRGNGYKLQAIWSNGPLPEAWDVTPLNRCEKAAAVELLQQIPVVSGRWLLGDGNYDASHFYDAAAARGFRLLTPLRTGKQPSKGHYQSPHRLAARALMRRARGRRRYRRRTAIERCFGHLGGFAGGLAPLAAWVRSLRRVRLWVWAKLIINAVRIRLR
jgi:Transposase DDE domain